MARPLAPDDLAPGMHVTVFGPARPPRRSGQTRRGTGVRVQVPDVVRTLMALQGGGPPAPPGVPLRVLAVDLPFVLAAPIAAGGGCGGLLPIDLRRVALAAITDAYVAAVVAAGGSGSQDPPSADDHDTMESGPDRTAGCMPTLPGDTMPSPPPHLDIRIAPPSDSDGDDCLGGCCR